MSSFGKSPFYRPEAVRCIDAENRNKSMVYVSSMLLWKWTADRISPVVCLRSGVNSTLGKF